MLGSDAWVIELFRVGVRGDADGLSYGWGRGGGGYSHSAAGLEERRTRSLPGAGDLQSGAESELTQVCAQPGRVIAKPLFPAPPQTFLYVSGLGGKGVTHLQFQIALYQP